MFGQHVDERPFWQGVAEVAEHELRLIVAHLRIAAKVESRAKSSGSVFGKAHRKPDRYSELSNFLDLAAARVLVPFPSDVGPVADEIHSHPDFTVLSDETKTAAPDRLEYQARHLDLRLSENLVQDWPERLGGVGPACEVQIHTFAQSLWASMSHLVTYKREDLPDEVERRVYRLVALCELFDSEAEQARTLVVADVDHVSLIASELQRYFYAFTGVEHSVDQAIALTAKLLPSIDPADRPDYPARLEDFVETFADRLRLVLTDRPESRGSAWLLRPEVLLVLERHTNAATALRAAWSEWFPASELARLVEAWGPTD
jgi:ppGpp synthetase/RelA/SpoT-type nucleotidyltranferase